MSAPADNTEDPWNEKTKEKFNKAAKPGIKRRVANDGVSLAPPSSRKSRSEWLDPCQEAATRSIKCLNRNGGDRAMCQEYFLAYRECKKNWINKRKAEGGGLFG